jgi:anhydro-N-acetylmuramic acid kinase
MVILGAMSGSSLDGLDLAVSQFDFSENGELRHWVLLEGTTIPFSESWRKRLSSLPDATAVELAVADADLGAWIGQAASSYLSQLKVSVDAIASHGHTVFHFPDRGLSLQIGSGAAIAAQTGITTVDDFRMQDVQSGGQGAPLAPLADQLLFPEYVLLLNLGGIANLSMRFGAKYIAFDSTGANQVLDALAKQLGIPFDDGGQQAAKGQLIPDLLKQALALPYHKQSYPKSLGNDWVQQQLLPLYKSAQGSIPDKLHTACRQIARCIAADLAKAIEHEGLMPDQARMMVSGGGALNTFLVQCIREECEKICSLAVELPSPAVIHYKEAVLMGLMGAMRLRHQANVLPSVTGARRAVCGGAVHAGASAPKRTQ